MGTRRPSQLGSAQGDQTPVTSKAVSVENQSDTMSVVSASGVRRRKRKAIQQDFEQIKEVYVENLKRFEGLSFDNEVRGWPALAQAYVFKMPNKSARLFIKEIKNTKLKVERQLK